MYCGLHIISNSCIRLSLTTKNKRGPWIGFFVYRVYQEERSVFWEVIVSVVLSKKKVYIHVSYSERFPR
jgi:hypothetical protein